MKFLIITPCGSESDVIQNHIEEIFKVQENFDIAFIVDKKTDNKTRQIIQTYSDKFSNVFMIDNKPINTNGSLNLATCYLTGYNYFLENEQYDFVIEMDVESHKSKDLINFMSNAHKGYDVIFASRNIDNSSNRSAFSRKVISAAGNKIANMFLNIKLSDFTSGFQGFSREALKSIDLSSFYSTGYFFQTELKYRVMSAYKKKICDNLCKDTGFYRKKCMIFCCSYLQHEKNINFIELPITYYNSNSNIKFSSLIKSLREFLMLFFSRNC